MIHSSHRNRKTKAMAEVLAMIAAVELAPHRQSPFREIEEGFRGRALLSLLLHWKNIVPHARIAPSSCRRKEWFEILLEA